MVDLVENPERLVPQEELLEKLWPETYVNPEVIRKYILEIRKVLGDRPDNPEFIETLPKRGYRFVASVRDEDVVEPSDLSASHEMDKNITESDASIGTSRSKEKNSSPDACSGNSRSHQCWLQLRWCDWGAFAIRSKRSGCSIIRLSFHRSASLCGHEPR
jgi:DNA-binding winged helix-turn-helix (wHTH) protein